MAAPRGKTSPPSSPAGDEGPEAFDEDLCGFGCHSGGVAPGSVSVGCEHGTYKVSEEHWRTTPAASQAPQTVHDRSVHFESEQSVSPDSGAVRHLLDTMNGHSEDLVKLWAAIREIQGAIVGLTSGQTPPVDGE